MEQKIWLHENLLQSRISNPSKKQKKIVSMDLCHVLPQEYILQMELTMKT